MDVKGVRLLERIGEGGLRLALRGTFDRAGLVQLANACGLKFPGMRTQAVDDQKILAAMVKEFLKDSRVRVTVMKALIRANEDLIARFGPMTPGEMTEEISRLPDADAGRALFALGDADDGRETDSEEIHRLMERLGGAVPAASEPGSAEGRLVEEIAVLRDRVQTLDVSLKARAAALEDLGQREARAREELVTAHKEAHHLRKEMAHMEEERTRLREENARLSACAPEPGDSGTLSRRVEEIAVRLNQLVREDRKIGHEMEEILRSRPAGHDTATPYVQALAASVEALRRELAEVKRNREEEDRRAERTLQDVAAEVRATHSELAQWRKASAEPAPRLRGDPQRVGLFVDVQNMYYAARQLNARLDFGALMATTTRDRRLIRAIAYVVQNRDIDQSGFLAMLQQKNYDVRRKDLRIRHDGSSKGDWDMEMALDILKMAPNLDVVVLATGDGDFVSLVTQIKTLGPKVEVYSFPGSTARELIEAADRHVPLDEGFLIRTPPAT
jgi:uncharacterized LabA/DUF88 family protein